MEESSKATSEVNFVAPVRGLPLNLLAFRGFEGGGQFHTKKGSMHGFPDPQIIIW